MMKEWINLVVFIAILAFVGIAVIKRVFPNREIPIDAEMVTLYVTKRHPGGGLKPPFRKYYMDFRSSENTTFIKVEVPKATYSKKGIGQEVEAFRFGDEIFFNY